MTPQERDIARRVWSDYFREIDYDQHESDPIEFASRFLDELRKSQEPVGMTLGDPISDPCGDVQFWLDRIHTHVPLSEGTKLFTTPPGAPVDTNCEDCRFFQAREPMTAKGVSRMAAQAVFGIEPDRIERICEEVVDAFESAAPKKGE